MADFVSMDELWDVGSVFRGFFSEPAGSSSDFTEWFEQPSREQQDQGFGLFDDFPGFLEAATPVLGDHLVGLVTHSPSEVKENLQFHFQEEAGSSTTVAATSSDDTAHAPNKYKRRKNQQKRVVKHVQADDVSSDLWAWRKYGQKPIKGSPFPRSYYRCSSSKGCVARKQVERSSSDPGMFIVTYTGDHSHAHPTRRSSLAGTTRSSTKFPTSSSSLEKQSLTTTPTLAEDSGNDYTKSVQLQSVCESNQTDEKLSCVIPRLVFSDEADEMFMGLDELEMAEWPWI